MLRRLWSGDGAIVSCGGDEGLSLDRDKRFFCRKHVRRNDLRCNGCVATISTGCEFWEQEPPSSATRSFYADIFEITVPAERELQLKAKTSVSWNGGERWTMGPRRLKSPHAMSGSVWPG